MPGSAIPDALVGSGGSFPDPMLEEFDHRRATERLAKRLADRKSGPGPLLIQTGDGTVRETGEAPSPESQDAEEDRDASEST